MELHHIGYLVKDMERAVTEFCALGYQKHLKLCMTRSGISVFAFFHQRPCRTGECLSSWLCR